MSTCNQLDLETLGSSMLVPENLPKHCTKTIRPWHCEYLNSLWFKVSRASALGLNEGTFGPHPITNYVDEKTYMASIDIVGHDCMEISGSK